MTSAQIEWLMAGLVLLGCLGLVAIVIALAPKPPAAPPREGVTRFEDHARRRGQEPR
jgi:hypothetical protein